MHLHMSFFFTNFAPDFELWDFYCYFYSAQWGLVSSAQYWNPY